MSIGRKCTKKIIYKVFYDIQKKHSVNKNIIKKNSNSNNKIVVGTFKYKKNAKKQIILIQKKYPKTTSSKNSKIVTIKVNGKKRYESRFESFTKKDAYNACKRLKKYGRDCFVRL